MNDLKGISALAAISLSMVLNRVRATSAPSGGMDLARPSKDQAREERAVKREKVENEYRFKYGGIQFASAGLWSAGLRPGLV